jgi:geranylgeranyl diphosphate synthase type II
MQTPSKDRCEIGSADKSRVQRTHANRSTSYACQGPKKRRQCFDIERYLRDRKASIDRALERYLRLGRDVPPRLLEAVCYSTLNGGKRFRPILTLVVGELFGAKRWALLPFASAIELIHCYSLIHDDLPALDNDDVRRGKPSCHKRFGEAIALLAGDALLTEAFFIISEPKLARFLGTSRMSTLLREFSQAAGPRGMIAGQSTEFEIDKARLTAADLEALDRLKTGALITMAARVGAIVGAASRRDLERITRYAQCLGLAFQITDDMLDAHELSVENPNGNNKAAVNYLSVAGSAGAADRVRALYKDCLKEIEPYGASAEPLRQIARYVAARTD